MAKDFDSIDNELDSLLGEFESDTLSNEGGGRKPIKSRLKSVGQGFKDSTIKTVTSTSMLSKVIDKSLPQFLGTETAGKITGIAGAVDESLDTIKKNIKDPVNDVTGYIKSKTDNKFINDILKKIEGFVGSNNRSSSTSGDYTDPLVGILGGFKELDNNANVNTKLTNNRIDLTNQILKTSLDMSRLSYANDLTYYRKSLELKYKTYTELSTLNKEMKSSNATFKELLNSIIHNTALPEQVKVQTSEAIHGIFREESFKSIYKGMISESDFVNNFKKQLNYKITDAISKLAGYTSALSLGGDISDRDIGSSLGRMFVDGVVGKGLNKLSGKVKKDSVADKSIGKVKDFIDDPMAMLHKGVNNLEGKGYDKSAKALGIISDLFQTSGNVNLQTPDDSPVTTLDKLTFKTLNVVIPSLLADIRMGVLKEKSPITYDYKYGKFVNKKDPLSQIQYNADTLIKNEGVDDKIKGLEQAYSNDSLSASKLRKLNKALINVATNGNLSTVTAETLLKEKGYVRELETLRKLKESILYDEQGRVIPNGKDKFRDYIGNINSAIISPVVAMGSMSSLDRLQDMIDQGLVDESNGKYQFKENVLSDIVNNAIYGKEKKSVKTDNTKRKYTDKEIRKSPIYGGFSDSVFSSIIGASPDKADKWYSKLNKFSDISENKKDETISELPVYTAMMLRPLDAMATGFNQKAKNNFDSVVSKKPSGASIITSAFTSIAESATEKINDALHVDVKDDKGHIENKSIASIAKDSLVTQDGIGVIDKINSAMNKKEKSIRDLDKDGYRDGSFQEQDADSKKKGKLSDRLKPSEGVIASAKKGNVNGMLIAMAMNFLRLQVKGLESVFSVGLKSLSLLKNIGLGIGGILKGKWLLGPLSKLLGPLIPNFLKKGWLKTLGKAGLGAGMAVGGAIYAKNKASDVLSCISDNLSKSQKEELQKEQKIYDDTVADMVKEGVTKEVAISQLTSKGIHRPTKESYLAKYCGSSEMYTDVGTGLLSAAGSAHATYELAKGAGGLAKGAYRKVKGKFSKDKTDFTPDTRDNTKPKESTKPKPNTGKSIKTPKQPLWKRMLKPKYLRQQQFQSVGRESRSRLKSRRLGRGGRGGKIGALLAIGTMVAGAGSLFGGSSAKKPPNDVVIQEAYGRMVRAMSAQTGKTPSVVMAQYPYEKFKEEILANPKDLEQFMDSRDMRVIAGGGEESQWATNDNGFSDSAYSAVSLGAAAVTSGVSLPGRNTTVPVAPKAKDAIDKTIVKADEAVKKEAVDEKVKKVEEKASVIEKEVAEQKKAAHKDTVKAKAKLGWFASLKSKVSNAINTVRKSKIGKLVGKVAKKIPGIGTAISLAGAAKELLHGNFKAAGMSVLKAGANLIPIASAAMLAYDAYGALTGSDDKSKDDKSKDGVDDKSKNGVKKPIDVKATTLEKKLDDINDSIKKLKMTVNVTTGATNASASTTPTTDDGSSTGAVKKVDYSGTSNAYTTAEKPKSTKKTTKPDEKKKKAIPDNTTAKATPIPTYNDVALAETNTSATEVPKVKSTGTKPKEPVKPKAPTKPKEPTKPKPVKIPSSRVKISKGDRIMLEYISKFESHRGNGGYDYIFGGNKYKKQVLQGKKLTDMTVGEVVEAQKRLKAVTKGTKYPTSAVGKYQFMYNTLQEIIKNNHIPLNAQFTGKLQDALILKYLDRRGIYSKWKKGEASNKDFELELSKIFASFIDPYLGYGHHKGQRKVRMSVAEVDAVLNSVKENLDKPDSTVNLNHVLSSAGVSPKSNGKTTATATQTKTKSKGFGNFLLDGMKSALHSLYSFFGIDLDKNESENQNVTVNDMTTNTQGVPTGTTSAKGLSAAKLAKTASDYVGKVHYKWGGKGNDSFLDCSGFVQRVVRKNGIKDFPGSTETILDWFLKGIKNGKAFKIDKIEDLEAGDIVLFGSHHKGRRVSHVGMMKDKNTLINSSGGPRCKTGFERGCRGVIAVDAHKYFARRRPNYMFRINYNYYDKDTETKDVTKEVEKQVTVTDVTKKTQKATVDKYKKDNKVTPHVAKKDGKAETTYSTSATDIPVTAKPKAVGAKTAVDVTADKYMVKTSTDTLEVLKSIHKVMKDTLEVNKETKQVLEKQKPPVVKVENKVEKGSDVKTKTKTEKVDKISNLNTYDVSRKLK